MTKPNTRIDIAFNATYATAASARTWTDVTDYVKTAENIRISHARQDEFSQAGPNTCSLMLDNSDGRFTPGLATSPYYPNVKIGRPIRVAVNLCTYGDNGTFEADAANWFGSNATVERSTGVTAHSGSAVLAVTAGTAANMAAASSVIASAFPVVAGVEYRASAWYRRGPTSRTCDLRIDWYDATSTLISTSISASISDVVTWTQITKTDTAPANAAYARVRALWFSPAAGEVHYLDDVRLDVDRFTGYVDEWPLEWPGVVGTFATSAISASSRMARIGLSDKLKSIVELEILADNPSAYYTLGEAEGATRANDSSGNDAAPLVSVGTGTDVTFGSATGPGTDGLTAATFAGGKSLQVKPAPTTPTAAWAECFFSTTGTSMYIIDATPGPGAALHTLDLFVNADGTLRGLADGSATVIIDSTAVVNDGETHHALLTATNGGDTVLYVDGVAVGTDATANTLGAIKSITVGAQDLALEAGAFAGTIAHVAIGYAAITSARATAHADAGLDGFAAEEADNRLARYASYAGIPAAEYSFSTAAVTPMAHIDTTGQGAVELMQKVATTDGGVLYDGRNGVLTYVDRAVRYNATAALTLNASAGQVEVGYAPKFDRSALKNKVTATASDGTYIVTAENTSSTAEYGVHSDSDLELATTDNNEAYAAAWWRVNTYGEPSARAPQLKVELAKRSAANQAIILAVDVSDKIAVDNLPSQSDENDKSFFVEGYTETITDSQHFIEFNVSPTTGFDVWEVGHATFGQYDAYPIAY